MSASRAKYAYHWLESHVEVGHDERQKQVTTGGTVKYLIYLLPLVFLSCNEDCNCPDLIESDPDITIEIPDAEPVVIRIVEPQDGDSVHYSGFTVTVSYPPDLPASHVVLDGQYSTEGTGLCSVSDSGEVSFTASRVSGPGWSTRCFVRLYTTDDTVYTSGISVFHLIDTAGT